MDVDLKLSFFTHADTGRMRMIIQGNTAHGGKYRKELEMREDHQFDIRAMQDFLADCSYEARHCQPVPQHILDNYPPFASSTRSMREFRERTPEEQARRDEEMQDILRRSDPHYKPADAECSRQGELDVKPTVYTDMATEEDATFGDQDMPGGSFGDG